MLQTLWVPGPLPGLNEIINAKGNRLGRGGLSEWNKMKKLWHGRVASMAIQQKIQRIESAHFYYTFVEPNRRRDPSNVMAGAIKIIEDGLQHAGLLAGDGWKNVLSIGALWECDDRAPGVRVGMES